MYSIYAKDLTQSSVIMQWEICIFLITWFTRNQSGTTTCSSFWMYSHFIELKGLVLITKNTQSEY